MRRRARSSSTSTTGSTGRSLSRAASSICAMLDGAGLGIRRLSRPSSTARVRRDEADAQGSGLRHAAAARPHPHLRLVRLADGALTRLVFDHVRRLLLRRRLSGGAGAAGGSRRRGAIGRLAPGLRAATTTRSAACSSRSSSSGPTSPISSSSSSGSPTSPSRRAGISTGCAVTIAVSPGFCSSAISRCRSSRCSPIASSSPRAAWSPSPSGFSSPTTSTCTG